jgi:hypothetical protein
MAEGKKSFIAYVDWKETFDALPDDKAGKLVKHLFAYVSDENPISDEELINLVFINIKLQLKRDLQKYECTKLKNKINGSKGGRPKNPKKPKKPNGYLENPTEPKKPDTDTVNDTDNEDKISFDVFWNLYDKKVGAKDKCGKKWDALTKEIQQKIIDTLPIFIASIKDKQYQPYPETYLNQKRWNDIIKHNDEEHYIPQMLKNPIWNVKK